MAVTSDKVQEGKRILVCAPFGRDAESLISLLRAQGYDAVACRELSDITEAISDAVGTVVLTEEALAADVDGLKQALQLQPSWSDLPLILLAAPRAGRMPNARISTLSIFDLATNSVVLERPLGKASLFSAVASAMRLRQKQFLMRDRMIELDQSETRLRLATAAASIGTWDFDPVANILQWDDGCKAVFGITSDVPISYEETFLAGLHPDDREPTAVAVSTALRPGGDGRYDIEYRTIGLEDGVERYVAAKGGAIFLDDKAVRFIGTVVDITERKRTEAALLASEAALRAERAELDLLTQTLEERVAQRTIELEEEMAGRSRAEEALRQAHKMEAVGQLTGGIAHDFNNMLTGIIGGINVAKRRIASGRLEDVDRFMDAATESANRAAALIARLLAFSRRQTLDAKPLEVNTQLIAMEELLGRTLPETITIEIIPNEGVGNVVADANQLESALLNLAINARDAMPNGGRLTIESIRTFIDLKEARMSPGIKPGPYVVIAVTDTGVGMPPEILSKVFEPFFTTKPIGQGTGLGLSMIYGFAQQSGGTVRIHSQPGEGTTIRLFLPATDEVRDVTEAVVALAPQDGQGQTVLVVEDDEAVRLLIREVLLELSYKVLEAGDADTALPILASGAIIDLMVSDVGLPGMNGRQLAEVARQHRSGLPILFVTGYAENAATKASFLGTNMAMISKPFAIDVFSAKISEMLSS